MNSTAHMSVNLMEFRCSEIQIEAFDFSGGEKVEIKTRAKKTKKNTANE